MALPRDAVGYVLSLPERTLRSASALSAGLLREIGTVAIPARLRRTLLYQNMVDHTLRFLIEQVGQVRGVYPGEAALAEQFLLRRTAGNGLELAGVLAFHASPVWVLAALADLTGAGRELLQEIAAALKADGLLDPAAEFDSVDALLDGLERTAAQAAQTINTPPLDVAGLRAEWNALRQSAQSLAPGHLPAAEILLQQWRDIQATAQDQQRSVLEISSLLALSAVARAPEHLWWLSQVLQRAAAKTGGMVAHGLLDHYTQALREIQQTGYLAYWTRQLRPYLRAAARHFSPRRRSLTQRLFLDT